MQSPAAASVIWTKRKTVMMVVAAVIILALAPLFAWMFMQTHEANKAFSVFSEALIAKDYDRAYELTSPEFHTAMSETAFANQQAALCSKLGELRQVEMAAFDTGEHEDGWTSYVSARFIFAHEERLFDFKMKKEGADWKVFGYSERD
jgi:hypothetical protein